MTLKSSHGDADKLTISATSAMNDQDQITRAMVVQENLTFLSSVGIHHEEVLARRLGFTNAATMERFLFRHKIPMTWKLPPEKGIVMSYLNNRQATRLRRTDECQNSPEQVALATACVRRSLRDVEAVRDVLSMLGLPNKEQQFADAS